MKRREFFRLAGFASAFALTIDPMKLLAADAPVSFGHTPGGVKEVATPLGPPQAPAFWITTFYDPTYRATTRRVHCMWKDDEYGLEKMVHETEIEMYALGETEFIKYVDDILISGMSKALRKVGAPALDPNRGMIRVWDIKSRTPQGTTKYVYRGHDVRSTW